MLNSFQEYIGLFILFILTGSAYLRLCSKVNASELQHNIKNTFLLFFSREKVFVLQYLFYAYMIT